MTDAFPPYGDPTTVPFWEAAARGELLLQRCGSCGNHQLYPRPFCTRCENDDVSWTRAAGTGTVYSLTTVHLAVSNALTPPYDVGLVDLDEGPRLLAVLEGGCGIGDTVEVTWRPREDQPPVPAFRRA